MTPRREQEPARTTSDLRGLRPADAAEVLSELAPRDRGELLESLPAERAGQLLVELDAEARREAMGDMRDDRAAAVVALLASDDQAELLRSIDDPRKERVLSSLEPEARARILRLLSRPADVAGGIMSLEVPTVRAASSVERARDELRGNPPRNENTTTLFVLDERGTLVGRLSLLRLLVEAGEARIEDVMSRDVVAVSPDTDQEEAAEISARYDLPAVPVVDEHRKLLGMLTFDDLFDVIEEEEAEDLSYFAGTGQDETPLDRSVGRAVRGRLPWLLLGLVGGIANVFVMGRFEGALERLVSVAFFVPAVLGLSGAVAIQSSSLVVRGMSEGLVHGRRAPWVASRELRVSLILGTLLGAALAATAYILTGGHSGLALAMLVALIAVVGLAAVSGALIPLGLDQLGFDPAVAMGPFLTAVNDVVALSVYLGIASSLLG